MLNIKSSLFIICYTFFYFYFPPLLPFNILHILSFFSLISLFVIYRHLFFQILSYSGLQQIIIGLCISSVYLFFVVIYNDDVLLSIYPYLLLAFEMPICTIFLCSYFKRNNFSINNIINLFLIVGLLQSIISLATFFVPEIKESIIGILTSRLEDAEKGVDTIYFMAEVRLNGLSSNLTFTTPMLQSILGLTALKMAMMTDIKYLVFTPFLFFSAIINARNSIIILSCGLIILMLTTQLNIKGIKRFSVILMSTLIFLSIIKMVLSDTSQIVYDWVEVGIKEIGDLFQGETTGYFYVLTEYYIKFPEGFSLFLGSGHRIFGLDIGQGSDVGYINDIWLGGIFFTLGLYFLFIRFYLLAYRESDGVGKFIFLVIIVTFLMANIKGTVVSNNDFMNFSMLISSIYILHNKLGYYLKK